MNITVQQLKGICPLQGSARLSLFVQSLNDVLPVYNIDFAKRLQHFIAQAAHETGSFNYLNEIASGKAYEGRKDLGNIIPGDGVKFKGRGIFQITGRSNYEQVSLHLFGDKRLLETPALLAIPENAIRSAAYFWQSHKLNEFADIDDILSITKKINGGTNGLQDRLAYLQRAKQYIK